MIKNIIIVDGGHKSLTIIIHLHKTVINTSWICKYSVKMVSLNYT